MDRDLGRLNELKLKLIDKYGWQYRAARELGLREGELSTLLTGRKVLTESIIQRLEQLLNLSRHEFLPATHPCLDKEAR